MTRRHGVVRSVAWPTTCTGFILVPLALVLTTISYIPSKQENFVCVYFCTRMTLPRILKVLMSSTKKRPDQWRRMDFCLKAQWREHPVVWCCLLPLSRNLEVLLTPGSTHVHDHRQPAKNLAWPNVQNHQMHFAKWLHFYTCMAHVPNISLSCSTFARAMPCFMLLGKALDFTSRTLVCFWMCSNEGESARKLSRIAKASVPTLCEQIRYLTFTSRGALAHAKNKHICHKTGHKWYTFCFCDLLRFFSACFLSGFARHDWDCSGLILASFSENLSNIAPEIAKKFICS